MVPCSRILVLATTFPRWRGDSEPAFVWELTRALAQRGFEMEVLVPHAPGAAAQEDWEGVLIRRFRYAPQAFEKVCYEGGAWPNLQRSWRARLALPGLLAAQRCWIRRRVASGQIGLVHSHWIIPQGFWAAGICRSKHVPLVLTAHAGDVFGLQFPLKQLARKALRQAQSVTANSCATSQAVQSIDPTVSPELVPMGIDVAPFQQTSTQNHLKGNPALLAAGRFAEKKGFHILLKALPAVLSQMPETHLHLVGFGPWSEKLHQLVDELSLREHVTIHGAVAHEEMPTFYLNADLFVQPSLRSAGGDQEGLGVTILEAMASGTAVVASADGGILDLVEDNRNGYLVSSGQPGLLAERICAAWADPNRQQLATRARNKVVTTFGWDGIADRFAEIYSRLLNN